MKERPILFSAPMVRALLAGTKTQTRRVVKPQPVPGQGMVNAAYCRAPHLWLRDGACDESDPAFEWRCPYGQPGDRLWVRESGAMHPLAAPEDPAQPWLFRHDVPTTTEIGHYWVQRRRAPGASYSTECRREQFLRHPYAKVVPSIHMPRWACRLVLEITDVRAERLQDISQADARAEGAPPSHPSIDRVSREFGYADFPRSWYAQLWEEINGAGSWAANPWVWAIEFRRLP